MVTGTAAAAATTAAAAASYTGHLAAVPLGKADYFGQQPLYLRALASRAIQRVIRCAHTAPFLETVVATGARIFIDRHSLHLAKNNYIRYSGENQRIFVNPFPALRRYVLSLAPDSNGIPPVISKPGRPFGDSLG
jgi:hypothetical protein